MKSDFERFETSGGQVIYRLPVQAFPRHVTNCYLVRGDGLTLIDTGSGAQISNDSLLECMAALEGRYGEKVSLADLDRVIITHGHIDHFGGLNFVLERSKARVGIHTLDRSTIERFQERLIVSSRNLQVYLQRAGVSDSEVERFIRENKWSKNIFKSVPADFSFEDGAVTEGGFSVFHTPGHCPGQVCLGLDDVLFTADHVLARITPNQSPEFIIRSNGLGHYYEALERVKLLRGYRVGLGGHEQEIEDIGGRIDEIIAFHNSRLDRTREICAEPKPIETIAREMFPHAREYHVLLAMTEAGAHVEYLHERGELEVTNIEEVEREANPVLLYRAI